jgi:murein L,D-transpeptidase YafK
VPAKTSYLWAGLALLIALAAAVAWLWPRPAGDLDAIRTQRLPGIAAEFSAKGLRLGDPVFIRIFKETDELELWVRSGERFALYKTFAICSWSGSLGPKLQEGDGQSPEGFYSVARSQMNPASHFHLSFNLGFPNAYDRAHGRTGSFLMVHGNCVSIGCYAMTDAGIEEIWLIADEALKAGQSRFDVHVFPFRFTDDAFARQGASSWLPFWRGLKRGYDAFKEARVPPVVTVANGDYVFN